MRFLDTHTGQIIERDPRTTDYAILSHTWREKEQLFDELKVVQARYKRLLSYWLLHTLALCIPDLPA